jgi:hypothetical protein
MPTPDKDPMTYTDTRPRYPYTLPDGSVVNVIHDHGETPKDVITFTLKGGRIVHAFLVRKEQM